jgi:epoxyqueuosine reductase
VDSAPVLERQWAQKSGLGWQGKNTLLLSQHVGSYFFLAEIIGNWAIEPDGPTTDHCGTCTRCIDACPTEAIVQPYVVDGSKCISYLTIELKEQVPQEFKNNLTEWAFGCDICQDVCPWNRFSTPHQEPRFEPSDSFLNLSKRDWQEMTAEVFTKHFQKSPLERAGLEKLKSTIFVE